MAAITSGKRLSATGVRDAVKSCGRTLVLPPHDGLPDDLELLEVQGGGPRWVAATISLYNVEEGRSDLSLELVLSEGRVATHGVRLASRPTPTYTDRARPPVRLGQ